MVSSDVFAGPQPHRTDLGEGEELAEAIRRPHRQAAHDGNRKGHSRRHEKRHPELHHSRRICEDHFVICSKWNVLPDGRAGEYLTDRLTDEAVGLIEQSGEKPFFLYFPHYGVHSPLQAPEKLTKKYERVPKAKRQGKPVYAAMVESIDNSVGRALDALRASGKEDDTVIIFTSDNGGFYKATSNAPLRANKGAYYEGRIRVPLIIKWPGISRAGRVIHEPVISNDLYPTCEIRGAGVKSEHMYQMNK